MPSSSGLAHGGGTKDPYLRLDLPDPKDPLLRHFRTTQAALVLPAPTTNRLGLETLSISGSAQFSREGLRQLQEKLAGKKLLVVDLRQESHGFLNGWPVSWYADHDWANLGKTLKEVESFSKWKQLNHS